VNRFAALLDALLFTPSRNGKLRLMQEYFVSVPDPERGWALAALTGELAFDAAKPSQVRALAAARVDPDLLEWSYDFVGDLAETVSLIWPAAAGCAGHVPSLSEIVEQLKVASRSEVGLLLERWLDKLDATGRWALLKLVTGSLRIGVSARLAKMALAEWGGVDIDRIEETWHGVAPPYQPLFDWIEGRGPLPGIYSRSGDDIGAAFPEIIEALPAEVTLDGELIVLRDGAVASFNDLQQRLNRKTPNPKLLRDYPAAVRLYDILREGGEDLRGRSFADRRRRLEAWYARERRPAFDLSPLVPFTSWQELRELRDGVRERGIEGLMLKRADSLYVGGRPKGPWFKWKRGALTLDTVLMYAQRGHGKRSSFYSDYTFGAWRGAELVPVGKAYSGFTDEELGRLDRWVRNNTVQRYGPVREVAPEIVLEIAFDSVHRSTRHKSGLAMRFPRIHRIRWDKPVGEADTVEVLEKLLR
jgi:DNA ligase-1